jgi:hypothetical protein
MLSKAKLGGLLLAAALLSVCGVASAQAVADDGEGVDSNVLWPAPGPSNFPTVQSSDIVGHTEVAFSGLFGYHRKPLALEIEDMATGQTNTKWVVEYAVSADFLWAFGIADIFQIGIALPVVLDQEGVGAMPLMPQGADPSTYKLAGSALRDIRLSGKTRFVGGQAEIPDRRGFGVALDVGANIPTGDELSFAGEQGFVITPTAVLDYHLCKFSAALNVGARLRTETAGLADLTVGHQLAYGLGVTGHFLDRTLLLSAEAVALNELADFGRMGMEYRGGVGYVPDDKKAVTIWLAGGSSAGTGDLLGTPQMRILLGITYAPGAEEDAFEW